MKALRKIDRVSIPERSEIRCFIVARNEAARLSALLPYYRRLGVQRFFIVDNASDDGMAEYLLTEQDVHVFTTKDSYVDANCGVKWVNALLDAYASGWTLTVDADELLVYPDSENLSLARFCAELDRSHSDGLLCFLLDMYDKGPINKYRYQPGSSLISSLPYFDAGPYFYIDSRGGPQIYGGVRERIFWNSRSCLGPTLSKIPLVRWGPDKQYQISTHTITSVRLALVTGCLLHFKFLPGFRTRTQRYLRDRNNIRGSSAYLDRLANDHHLSLWYPRSVRYSGTSQLRSLGLLRDDSAGRRRVDSAETFTNIFPPSFGRDYETIDS